ncbi:MoxR family ATPase [Iamia sp.]|uniref:AAA family ATPase n=1 Tax=Iamia sp. TaxID=2722710 RepID=UPI002CFD0D5B|nr:MoxR family ATPase [Iamia sp.]HXH58459.1 MoxR family ATPase [Iamia sp.]
MSDTAAPETTPAAAPSPGEAAHLLDRVQSEIRRVIVGQDRAIERLVVCLLAQGHCLLEGVPGLAKTLAAETLARTVGGTFARIQFTPDLLPADVMGTRIFRASKEEFDIELGPVFVNFLLADEINRAPAKVQSSLLEVMAERQVSIGGKTFRVPNPFLVLATQNPIESEGVYPLPEAQRDRFLMKVVIGYPTAGEEVDIVYRMGVKAPEAESVLTLPELIGLQGAADAVRIDRSVVDYAVTLVLSTRYPGNYALSDIEPLVTYGGSPRASLGLIRAGRSLALLRGRDHLVAQDVFDVAPDVLRHRLVLSYEALAQGVTADQVLARVLSTVPAPRQAGLSASAAGPDYGRAPSHAGGPFSGAGYGSQPGYPAAAGHPGPGGPSAPGHPGGAAPTPGPGGAPSDTSPWGTADPTRPSVGDERSA